MVSSASRSVSCRAFLVWIERNPLPSPTKGFVGHYSRKPDLASKSRGLQLIGFGALRSEARAYSSRCACIVHSRHRRRASKRNVCRRRVWWSFARRKRSQITGSKARREFDSMRHQRQSSICPDLSRATFIREINPRFDALRYCKVDATLSAVSHVHDPLSFYLIVCYFYAALKRCEISHLKRIKMR